MCYTIKILIAKWPDLGRENSASCSRPGRRLLLTFLTMVKRWSRSTSNFYALIGQHLTGEFMRKIYAASWILFTMTAEADRVLCQLVVVLTVFFHWMCKMKFPCYSWLVCLLGFWLRNTSRVKVGNPISGGIVFVLLQSLKRYWLLWIPFRSCISNGKREKQLYLMFVVLDLI